MREVEPYIHTQYISLFCNTYHVSWLEVTSNYVQMRRNNWSILLALALLFNSPSRTLKEISVRLFQFVYKHPPFTRGSHQDPQQWAFIKPLPYPSQEKYREKNNYTSTFHQWILTEAQPERLKKQTARGRVPTTLYLPNNYPKQPHFLRSINPYTLA